MSRRQYRDFSPPTTLTADINSAAVTCSVASLVGFPTTRPFVVVIDRNESNAEAVLVTGVSGTTATIERDINGLGSFGHTANAKFEHAMIAMDLDEANAHVNSDSGVHGVTGDVVGTTDEQTLTNKTIEGSLFNATGGTPGAVFVAAAHTDNAFVVEDATNSDTVVAKIDGSGKLTAGDAALAEVTTETLSTSGDAEVGGGLTVDGHLGVTTGAAIAGGFSAGGGGTISGGATVHNGLTVDGTTTLGFVHGTGNATVDGNSTLTGDVAVGGNETVAGTLAVTGATTVTGTLSGAGDVKSHSVAVPLGIIAVVSVTDDSDSSSGTTEKKDSAFGDLTFTALAGRRYRIQIAGRGLTGDTTDDRFAVNVRDGGSTSPTSASPLWSHNIADVIVKNGETASFFYSGTSKPTAGTRKLGVFFQRIAGSGTAKITGSGEITVEDCGAI